jgi:hypothetical protein
MALPATPKSTRRLFREAGSRRCSTLRFTAWSLLTLAGLSSGTGCRNLFTDPGPVAPTPVLAAGALLPSPRLIIGRIVAVDEAQRLAFVELATDAPNAALIAGTELVARTMNLRDSGRLQVSAYVRGRTLGTQIVGGQPSPGDEVVWLAP